MDRLSRLAPTFIAVAAGVAILGVAIAQPRVRGATPAPRLEVVTGDSFKLNGRLVRIAGVTAPRPPPAAKCWAEAALAYEAANSLRSILGDGRQIVLDPQPNGRVRVINGVADVAADLLSYGDVVAGDAPFAWCSPSAVRDPSRSPRLGGDIGELLH